ncbi:MAG: ABC transporter ATP-binding protein [Coriobacteriales bacterium]|nr:ABC transporter ATP-binding protein [Coriobacteriales bacterium]
MSDTPATIKISVKDLTKVYGTKTVLDHVSFEVQTGEFLSILGPSGCGKTTILRILIGLLEPTEGTVYKDGKDITGLSPSQRGMGIVFQNYALFENMNVQRNVEYALRFNKETKDKASGIAENLVKRVGLWEERAKKPGKLSGGQQQRVAIARTLALNPDVILFDEPMSALDVDTRLSLRKEIKDIQAEYGSTMIYITHDQEEAFAMSDRIMVMETGKIHQIATPEEIVKNPADEYVERFVLQNLQTKVDSLARFIKVRHA